jgi:uncharacterized protein YkwD
MVSLKTLCFLAVTGSVIAAPHGGPDVIYETEIAVATVVVTVGANAPAYTPPPQVYAPVPEQPKPSTVVKVVETPAPQPNNAAPAATGYMSIVNEYRAKLGLPDLTQDSQLEANAYKTCEDGHGEMVHQLNPPSMAQVLAPGGMDDFKHIFVGAWLCEKPDMAGLNGECSTQSQGWSYISTGHADILTSTSYTHIGCAGVGGVTGCDLS